MPKAILVWVLTMGVAAQAVAACDLTEQQQILARDLGEQFIEGSIDETTFFQRLAAVAPIACFESGRIQNPIDPPADYVPPDESR